SRATFDLKSAEYRFRVTLPIFPSFIRSGLAYHSVRISGAISRMEDFHIALAKNQFQADRRGLLGMVGNIGGTLTLAVIDATGIRSRTINAFPFEPLPAAVTVADIMIREQFKFLQDS
ncbi:hypothetical protein, partial [Insolitispirillum peregrinum]